MTRRTKDELFMIRLYEEAQKQAEQDHNFDRYEIGKLAGIPERGVDTICALLLRANFIKKAGDVEIYLTPHGAKLAESLMHP